MEGEVIVLMSTYNGRTFLNEQLKSIFDQTYGGKITVLIRDDGSSDETIDIIKSYPVTESRAISLIEGENCGPQRSFLELIRVAPYVEAYFFADQDDVWDSDKIEIAVREMKIIGDRPAVYCSNYRLSDNDLNVYKEKAIESTPKFTPLRVLFYNQIPGCTMGFNSNLMALLKKIEIDNVMMHDSMVLSFCAYCGEIVYDEESRITHRIHGGNVVGDGHKKIRPFRWLKEKFRLLVHKEDYDVSKMAEQFQLATQGLEDVKYSSDIELLKNFKKKCSFTRKLLRHPDSKGKAFDRTTMSIRSKILFHLF